MTIINSYRMSFTEDKVLEHLALLIEKEMPEAVRIIVYGSRARGESDEHSDLDVAIILDLQRVGIEHWHKIWEMKWRVLEALDAVEMPLSLTLMTESDLSLRDFGLEKEIKKEGRVVWERGN